MNKSYYFENKLTVTLSLFYVLLRFRNDFVINNAV